MSYRTTWFAPRGGNVFHVDRNCFCLRHKQVGAAMIDVDPSIRITPWKTALCMHCLSRLQVSNPGMYNALLSEASFDPMFKPVKEKRHAGP